MIALYKIAYRNFVLVRSDQSATQALEIVHRLQPLAVIVRRLVKATVYYHLYLSQDFEDYLAHVRGDELLVTALDLLESSATPTLDGTHDAENAPPRCVITDEDYVSGFYDVSLPPAAANSMRGESRDAGPCSPAAVRSLRTEFPEEIAQGQTASLLVWLTNELGGKLALPDAVPLGAKLDIIVQARRGFVIEGLGEGSISVTDEKEALPIQFKLRAAQLGPGLVRVLSFHNGQPLGAITLTPTVVANTPVSDLRSGESKPLPALTVVQPDLTLMIEERTDQGQTEIRMRLSAADPALGLYFKPFAPVVLRMNPLGYFQDFFRDIEGLAINTPEEQGIAARKLTQKGTTLFESLLPEELRALLWSLRTRIVTIQVLSDEPWIPWELLKLYGREGNRVVEGQFLCEAFAMTRWFLGIERRPALTMNRMAIVVPSDSGLSQAKDERAYLLALANQRRTVAEVPAYYIEVLDALSLGEYNSWHFTGHGQFLAPDPNRSAILLEQGQELCAEEITGVVSNCGVAQPLVFLNACQTGRAALSLTGIGGWARRFVEVGAAAFIGSLWSVNDEAACAFAKSVYSQLLNGKPIGQAVQTARTQIKHLNDQTWMAYTVFADPMAAVAPQEGATSVSTLPA